MWYLECGSGWVFVVGFGSSVLVFVVGGVGSCCWVVFGISLYLFGEFVVVGFD